MTRETFVLVREDDELFSGLKDRESHCFSIAWDIRRSMALFMESL